MSAQEPANNDAIGIPLGNAIGSQLDLMSCSSRAQAIYVNSLPGIETRSASIERMIQQRSPNYHPIFGAPWTLIRPK